MRFPLQRIPRAGKQNSNSASPCEEVTHIHRHVVKGWTTNPHSDEAYRPVSKMGLRNQRDAEEKEEIRRLPDQTNAEESLISGHYRVILVKTPQTGNIQDIDI